MEVENFTQKSTIRSLAAAFRTRTLSPCEFLESVLLRIQETEERVHAYSVVLADRARKIAKQVEAEFVEGSFRGPLHGIPVAVKDVFCMKGVETTAGSRTMRNFISKEDSAVVSRLKQEGAIIVGTTVTPEFAYGQVPTPARNPWRLDFSPGGSSTGAAVAVAVGSAVAAVGTDTGGSIRNPASMNGVTGLKPTFGLVATRGIVGLSGTLDHCGPLAKNAEDIALLLSSIASTANRRRSPKSGVTLRDGINDIRLGIDRSWLSRGDISPDVETAVHTAVDLFRLHGAEVVPVNVPGIDEAVPAGITIMLAEASAYHQQLLRDRPEDYSADTRFMLELGELLPATDYLRALRARERIIGLVRSCFESQGLSAMLTPTLPTTAPRIDALKPPPRFTGPFTIPFNLTGQPAVSIPCGFGSNKMPIGLQIIGRPFDELTILRLAHTYQSQTDWHLQMPPIRPS